MSYGTDFKADIFLNRKNYRSIQEIEEAIEDIEVDKQNWLTNLNMLAIANIRDIVPTDWNSDPILWLNIELKSIYEGLETAISDLVKLRYYLEYAKQHGIKKDEL